MTYDLIHTLTHMNVYTRMHKCKERKKRRKKKKLETAVWESVTVTRTLPKRQES